MPTGVAGTGASSFPASPEGPQWALKPWETIMNTKKDCRCFIRHPQGKVERDRVIEALEYARTIGDTAATMICIVQLGTECAS